MATLIIRVAFLKTTSDGCGVWALLVTGIILLQVKVKGKISTVV